MIRQPIRAAAFGLILLAKPTRGNPTREIPPLARNIPQNRLSNQLVFNALL
jgi:hypothetical protein